MTAQASVVVVLLRNFWLFMAVPMDIAPRYAGVAGGFISTSAGLAAVISPVAFGFITDVTGSYRLPFALSIALLFVGIVLSFNIRADLPVSEPVEGQPGPLVMETPS